LNFAQLREAVRTRIGVPPNDSYFTDVVLSDLVNEALQAITAEADWPWLELDTTFTTVAGTDTYTPPADWTDTRVLGIDGQDAMEWRPLAEILEEPTTHRGMPSRYTVSGEKLILRPVPDGAYTVRHHYVKNEQTLVTDADVPLMPTQFRYAVAALAAHLALMRSGDTARAASQLAEFQGWLKRMMQQRRRSRGPLRVRVRAGQVI
jgi:hypothetical protein